MKVFYLGTICNVDTYEKMLSKSKTKPTIATIVFETAMLEGFSRHNLDMDIYSYPMIPNFCHSKKLYWGNMCETLNSGYVCNWLRTFNVIFLKQLTRRLDGRRQLKKWLKKNVGHDCVILIYGIPPFIVKDIVKLSRKYDSRCFAIVPDLPRDMYLNSKKTGIKAWLRHQYLKPALRWQGEFDGYIYLTEAMSSVINSYKPYIVVEGILNDLVKSNINNNDVKTSKAIMYAGGLNYNYGVINLLDAFENAEIPDTELWLFGEGDALEQIKARAQKNSSIHLFGRKSRKEVLDYEIKATLLVNPRSSKDEYTKYSFPSKTIEYMYSGTPLLTTRLKGIPPQYYDYVFSIADNDIESLTRSLKDIFSLQPEELISKGRRAKDYIALQKNSSVQSKRIIDFIEKTKK